jgi:hypothetical protein
MLEGGDASRAPQGSSVTSITGLPMFEEHHDIFEPLTHREFINTQDDDGNALDIISMAISYDSKYLIACCANEHEDFLAKGQTAFNIIGYSLGTFKCVFSRCYSGEFMKVNLIDQTYAGDIFVIAYSDNGKFKVTFLAPDGTTLDDLDVSAALSLDAESKPVTGFEEPLITVAVLPDGSVFVSAYHRILKKQYYFMYQHKNEGKKVMEGKITAGPMSREIDDASCGKLNFPIKSFYSEKTGNCTTFYRQGHCVTVNAQTMESSWERIISADLGAMYLLFDACLVTRSSGSILFFRIDEDTGLWMKHYQLDNMRGEIYFIRGNKRIQVVTDDLIYFYIVDDKTLLPERENVMNNDTQSSVLMFGRAVRYGVAYKTSEPGFRVWSRKYYHNFKVAIDAENYEGSQGVNLGSMNHYCIANQVHFTIFDEKTFEKKQTTRIPDGPDDGLDKFEILYVTASKDEKKLAFAAGYKRIKDIEEIHEILVYSLDESTQQYEIEKIREFKYRDACVQFQFDRKDDECLLFFCKDELCRYYYNDEGRDREEVYQYKKALEAAPKFGVFNKDQS